MDFQQRLQRAVARGEATRQASDDQAAAHRLTTEELRALHSKLRLDVSEHISDCLKSLVDELPGFNFSTVMDEAGWGARVHRDDLKMARGQAPERRYSSLSLVVEPFGDARLLSIVAKGVVNDREVLTRSHFDALQDADPQAFKELIDLWVLQFAEAYVVAN